MTYFNVLRAVSAAAVLTFAATAAQAHGALVSALPAAGATVAPTKQIKLKFNEALKPKFSGAELAMTSMMMGGKMTTHSPMKIGGLAASVDPKDAKTMLVTAKTPLAPGGYKLTWHVVTSDNHRVEGDYAFTVR